MIRFGEVLESSKLTEWRHISTKDNVADDATKWKTKFKFNMNDRWFTGPQFLLKNEQNWPQKLLQFSSLISEEIRPHLLMVHSNASNASEN